MDISKLINKSSFGLELKAEKIKEKIEAYDTRINISGASRVLSAYMPLSPEELKRKRVVYGKYITDNIFRGNAERTDVLQKWFEYSNQTRLENLIVEMEEDAEEFYYDFSKDLYETLKENFKKTYAESEKEIKEKIFGNSYYYENTVSDEYFNKVMTEKYSDDDISFYKAIENRKKALQYILKERISSIILLEPTSDRLVNYVVDDIINKEKAYVERFIKNEIIKIQNKAKIKSYTDLEIANYIIKENSDEKICEKCSEQNGQKYLVSKFEIGKTAPPFHINCRGTIEPDLEDSSVRNKVNFNLKRSSQSDKIKLNSNENSRQAETKSNINKENLIQILKNVANVVLDDKKDTKQALSELTDTVTKTYNNLQNKAQPTIVEPNTEGTAESLKLNSSPDTISSTYNEYIRNRAGSSLDLKRKYAVEIPKLNEIMSFVTPAESGSYDTEENLNNEEYRAAYKEYFEEAESRGEKPVNINIFLNSVLPVIEKVKNNQNEVYSGLLNKVNEFFIDFKNAPEEVKEKLNNVIPYSGELLDIIPGKSVFDSGINLVGSAAESNQKSSIDNLLDKDGLLDKENTKNNDESEITEAILDLAYKILDFKGKGKIGNSISRNLYASLEKETSDKAKEEIKKELIDKAKDVAVESGKQILKNEVRKFIENNNFNKEKSNLITIDDKALKHSTVGDFTINPKTGALSKIKGGGHGQSNIELLKKIGFKYEIVKEYDNGVRIGNIENHKSAKKRAGTTGQAWFPEKWSDSMIKEAGEYVANLPENINLPNGFIGYGEYNGVRIGVIKTNGKIATVFPDADLQP